MKEGSEALEGIAEPARGRLEGDLLMVRDLAQGEVFPQPKLSHDALLVRQSGQRGGKFAGDSGGVWIVCSAAVFEKIQIIIRGHFRPPGVPAMPVHCEVPCRGVEPCALIFRCENGVAAACQFHKALLHEVFRIAHAPGGSPEITEQPVRMSGMESVEFVRRE